MTSKAYKVRLEDGSEIGPLDLAAVREWHARGLIHAGSPVLTPHEQRWTTLRDVLGGGGARPDGAARRVPARAGRGPAHGAATQRHAAVRYAALGLGLALAVGAGYLVLRSREPGSAPPAPVAPVVPHLEDLQQEAVRRALEEVPHLTARSAAAIMSRSQAEVLGPEETFRRSQVALRRALRGFSAAETRELGALTDAVYARLTRSERSRLAGYLDRLRDNRPTTPAEDREMARLVKGAERKLSPPRLERLRRLYEKATVATAGES